MRGLRALIFSCAICLALAGQACAEDVRVFAAASLSTSMQEVADAFKRESGHRMRLVHAGSSTLARQIEAGARADIFLSADQDWMDHLQEHRLLEVDTRRALLGNRLVVVVPASNPVELKVANGSRWILKLGEGRIAMGDPAHVPVGKYAKAALEALGVWQQVLPRLAPALDTRAAMALVERGEVAAGIAYATDAAASRDVRIAGEIPSGSYPTVTYPIARLAAAGSTPAKAAYRYLCGPAAAAIFKRHGFILR